jgi:S1-C subfamily serine protease
VIDRIVAASAKVTVEQDGSQLGAGSGVVVASRYEGLGREAVSYVLTAAHLLEGKEGASVFVRFSGQPGANGRFAATIPSRGRSDGLDLALLRVPGIAVQAIAIPANDGVRLGEEILVVGFPWGKRMGLFSGIVSQVPVRGEEDGALDEGAEPTIVVDAASSKGVSGGGVFRTKTGSLLGIVEGYQTASIAIQGNSQTYSLKVPLPGETFVVPISQIRHFLDEAGMTERSVQPARVEARGN